MGRGVRSTVWPLRAALYSGWPLILTAEYIGGSCICRPINCGKTAFSSASPTVTGAVSSAVPVTSPVSVRRPRRNGSFIGFIMVRLAVRRGGGIADKHGEHTSRHRIQCCPRAPACAFPAHRAAWPAHQSWSSPQVYQLENGTSIHWGFPFQFIVLHSAAAPSCGASLAAASRRCHLAGLQACAASPCAARCGAAGLQPAS